MQNLSTLLILLIGFVACAMCEVSMVVQGLDHETLANFQHMPYTSDMSVRDLYIEASKLDHAFTYSEVHLQGHYLLTRMMHLSMTPTHGWFYEVNGELTNAWVDVTKLKDNDHVRWFYARAGPELARE